MKQFQTAAEEVDHDGEDEGIEFEIDGVMCRCFHPGDGQLAIFMASNGRHTSTEERVAGIINFFASVLDDSSNSYVVGRLLDRRDAFGLKQVEGILMWMIEEWSARPTRSLSGSTQSPQSIGSTSTQSTPASI